MSELHKSPQVKKAVDHKVVIDNRKKVVITAVTKAVSANTETVVLMLANSKLNVIGKNLHIAKLDVAEGVAEIDGDINAIKYLGASDGDNKNFFKRMFK